MTLAWSAMVGDHTDKLVLLALADNANDEGKCYPSLTKIAEKCEMGRRTVVRSILNLQTSGHISRRLTPGRVNTYSVHPVPSGHQCQSGTSANGAPTSANGAPLPPPYNPPPSENRHKPSTRTRKTVSDEPPPSNLNVEAWHRWVQYRQEIRRPIKPVSIPAAQRKLAGFGSDQAAVVEQSIASGYQGLFPLKDQRPHRESAEWR